MADPSTTAPETESHREEPSINGSHDDAVAAPGEHQENSAESPAEPVANTTANEPPQSVNEADTGAPPAPHTFTMTEQTSPASIPPVTAEPDAQALPEGPVDPQVASLQAMFPDFDVAVLQYVLESVGGDHERAVDTLLGMSDPDYVSQQPVAPARAELTQTELDEQLAHRLMLEDQEQFQRGRSWEAQQQSPAVPYDSRNQPQQRQRQGGPVDNPTGERDTMAEFTEQFNKIAETGKKTFGSLVSKVKAKIQEYDQNNANRGTQDSGGTPTQWAQWGNSANHNSWQAEQQSYYDPNLPIPPTQPAQSYNMTPQPNFPTRQLGAMAPPVTGYSVAPSSVNNPRPISPAGESGGTPPPPATNSGASGTNIDPGKLGLLPKRPVSLLRPNSTQATRPSDEDEDELEYVENPFEEHR